MLLSKNRCCKEKFARSQFLSNLGKLKIPASSLSLSNPSTKEKNKKKKTKHSEKNIISKFERVKTLALLISK
jgi:hypothetical protein